MSMDMQKGEYRDISDFLEFCSMHESTAGLVYHYQWGVKEGNDILVLWKVIWIQIKSLFSL